MNSIKLLMLLVMFGSFAWNVSASTQQTSNKAELLFEEGQYEDAIREWNSILKSGGPTAGVYYNIGLAEARLGNSGKAMVAFEQALRFKPNNGLINRAIVEERSKLQSGSVPASSFFLLDAYRTFLGLMRPGLWACLGLALLAFGVIFRLWQTRHSQFRDFATPSYFKVLMVSGLLMVMAGMLAYQQVYRRNEAILMVSASLMQAPSADSPLLSGYSPGEKLIILDQLGEYYKVRLQNYDEGWLRTTDCQIIMP